MTSDYDRFFNGNFEEKSFEASNIELYQNKQNFRTAFPSQFFGKEGKYFFPGTLDELYFFISMGNEFKDQKSLFSMYKISPFLKDKIKNWPYNKLTCSVLYSYLNIEIVNNNLDPQDWGIIGDFLQSPAVSQDTFSFVKYHNILKFSSKNHMISGFIASLMFFPYIYYCKSLTPLEEVKILYRFLKLVNVEKVTIRNLIKTTIREQNRLAILTLLESLYDENEEN